MENKQPNLAAFNEWICVKPLRDHQTLKQFIYIEGMSYWFHEDSLQDEKYFKLVVDETDTPIKKLVRWE